MLSVFVPDDLWATSMMPQGLVDRWLVRDGAAVAAGDPIAVVRVEGALHELMSPGAGRLAIAAAANSVITPGALIATVEAA